MTVLFTDLVSSTQLMSRMGDSAFDELRQLHFDLLGQVIASHGGVEVKNLGDGVMAVFGAASDAVDAAVAMQQSVARRARYAPAPLSMRVGVALGDATEHGDDWFGTPVVQAARLCAHCAGGQILVTDTVRAVAESRTNASFASIGKLPLRGLDTEPTVWTLEWTRMAATAAVALPDPLQIAGVFGFVGRQPELATVRAAFDRATSGSQQVLLLGGEPGVGKSRLAAEFAREVHAEGTTVLFGRCDEGLAMPYQPFVDALSHYAHHAPPDELRNRLGNLAGELTRLVPELAELVPGLPGPLHADPETERYRLFNAIAAWLCAASAEEPLLLILDDLHWATQATLLLLRHVTQAASPAHLLIMGIYRHTEPEHSLDTLLADLRRVPGVERVLLGGLDEAEVMAFLESTGFALGNNAWELARAIRAHTEGNPFFVGELVRHAAESGILAQENDENFAHMGIPEGVHEVVLCRLGRLSQTANQTMVTAAVVGAEFDAAILAVVTGLTEETVADVMETVMAAGLVKEVSGGSTMRFRFRHQLVRASLYTSLSTPRRLRLHRRVGEAIEMLYHSRLDGHLPALAHHFAQAAADGDPTTAVGYTWRAGDRALAQLAHDQAAELYGQALELFDSSNLADDTLRRCDLLIALGEAQRRAAHPAHRQTLLDAVTLAQELGDVDRLTTAALANVRTIGPASEVDDERVAALTTALEAISDDDSAVRARLLANLAGELFDGEWDRRVELSRQAEAMARRLNDPVTLAQVLIPLVRTLRHPSTLARRLSLTAELAELAEQLGDADINFSVAWYGIGAAMEAGDIALAQRRLDDATHLACDLAQPALRWATAVPRAALTMLAGRIQESEQLIYQALEAGTSVNYPDAQYFFGVQLLAIKIVQERLGDIEPVIADVIARYPEKRVWQPVLALVYCDLGRWPEARSVLEKMKTDDFASFPYDFSWLPGMALSAEVCADLSDAVAAAVLYKLLAPYADHFVTAGPLACFGSLHRHLGRLATTLGHFDQANAHFAAAAAAHTRVDAPALLARTQLDWATLLLSRESEGDIQTAATLLDLALACARRLGLSSLEQRANTTIENASQTAERGSC